MLAKSPQVDGHTHSVTPRNIGLISPDPVRDGYSAEPSVPFCQKVLDRVRSFPSTGSASLTEAAHLGAIFHGAVAFPAAGAAAATSRAIQNAGLHIAAKDSAAQLLHQYLLQE
jgi:hypothetical protein